MLISLLVAASTNDVIGVNNQLPWHLPNDMKFFKNTTWGMPVIMGRKTFESMNSKALPGRVNIILTKQDDFKAIGAVIANSWNDAMFIAKETDCNEVFIIGGGEIFKEIMNKASRIYMTRVDTMLDGDVFFPTIEMKQWKLASKKDFASDAKHLYNYSFEVWQKK